MTPHGNTVKRSRVSSTLGSCFSTQMNLCWGGGSEMLFAVPPLRKKKRPHYNVRLYYFLQALPECVFVCERRCILSGGTRTALSGKSEELWWFFFLPAVFKACALSCGPALVFSWLYNKHVGVSRSRNTSRLSFNHLECDSLSRQRHYVNENNTTRLPLLVFWIKVTAIHGLLLFKKLLHCF